MGAKTGISWTQSTWNPVVGCSVFSAGCKRCYAMKMAARLESMGIHAYDGLTVATKEGPVWNGVIRLNPKTLDQPFRWKKPRLIFANSMSDLFHEGLPMEAIATVYSIAVASVWLRGHRIQILTKRAERMHAIMRDPEFWGMVNSLISPHGLKEVYGPENPPRGIWLGVSTENQEEATYRLSFLINTPAWRRFVSVEPFLGPVTMRWLGGIDYLGAQRRGELIHQYDGLRKIHLVIAGSESGKGARYMNEQWPSDLLLECVGAGVPFFMKQMSKSDSTGRANKDMATFPAHLQVQEMPWL